MQLAGANPAPRVVGCDPQPGRVNYFVGNNPAHWEQNVATYAKVRYEQVYPGVDLVYYGNQRQLEYDLVVAPGADARRIRLTFRGADRTRVDSSGDLVLSTPAGEVRQSRPVVYQVVDGQRRRIEAGYVLLSAKRKAHGAERRKPGRVGWVPARSAGTALRSAATSVAFRIGAYDPRRSLVIDPQLVASTLLGGSGDDFERGVAVDADGNAYLAGITSSRDFPGTGFRSPQNPNTNTPSVYVAKISADGTQLLYGSIIGGLDQGIYGDQGQGVAVDPDGNAWVGGYTTSRDYPTTAGALEPQFPDLTGRPAEGFLTKLSADGSQLLYSTYFGGNGSAGDTEVFAVTTGLGGRAYITGSTSATDDPNTHGVNEGLPLKNAVQGFGGFFDAFVASFDPNGVLLYSTYLGGTGQDRGYAIAVDASGVAYVTGVTDSHTIPSVPTSRNFPTTPGAFQTEWQGNEDGFVTSVAQLGGQFFYSTYLGGSGSEFDVNGADFPAAGIAVDPEGNVYVTSWTSSRDFPTTAGAFQTVFRSLDRTAFVTKIRPDARLPRDQQLIYSTFLGGSGLHEYGKAITVDSQLNAYVTGWTFSADFPLVNGFPNSGNAFLSVLNSAGSGLLYSTRLGTGGVGEGRGVALGVFGDIYVAGDASPSSPWPTTDNAFQRQFKTGHDAFLMRIRISESDIRITSCSVAPASLPASGGPVTITAGAQSQFGISTVTAHLLHPNGPAIDLPLALDAASGNYTAVFNAPATTSLQPEPYTVSINATDRANTQVSAACGTFTVGAQTVVITDCQVNPQSLTHRGGNVSITATVASSEKLRSAGPVVALISPEPGGPPVRVSLALRNGVYRGTFHAPANNQPQDKLYGVLLQATTRSGAQATRDCGTITVTGRPLPVITSCQVDPTSLTSQGGLVSITAAVNAAEGVHSVAAVIAPQPAGVKKRVVLSLKNGLYGGTFKAPTNKLVQDKVYGVTIQATSLTGAQASQDCGTITVAGKAP